MLRLMQSFVCILAIINSSILLAAQYTVLNKKEYMQTVLDAREDIQSYFSNVNLMGYQPLNTRIDMIVEELRDTPYLYRGAMGEGDWQSTSLIYKPGAVHIDQDPVYRLDGVDCQTFVQVVMAMLYATSLSQFDENMVKIGYGAVNLEGPDLIHYYNRNHFVEADFNPVNQQRGFLQDVTSSGVLAQYAKTTQVTISRRHWLERQQARREKHVRVLNAEDGDAMLKRFTLQYKHLKGEAFKDKLVAISYIPKNNLAIRLQDGTYIPNQGLIDLIPAPAVAEIVCDAKKWTMQGKLIKDMIGTELSVSHFGLLYRKTFHRGELIYRKTTCGYAESGQIECRVKPISCRQSTCKELMFANATDMYPSRHYWYQQSDGNFTCTSAKPNNHQPYTTCNRVESLPLFNYLTNYQFGSYWYMNTPSILGVHVEKLVAKKPSLS